MYYPCSSSGSKLGEMAQSFTVKLDVNAFNWLQENYTNVKINARCEVEGGSDHRAQQWLGLRKIICLFCCLIRCKSQWHSVQLEIKKQNMHWKHQQITGAEDLK